MKTLLNTPFNQQDMEQTSSGNSLLLADEKGEARPLAQQEHEAKLEEVREVVVIDPLFQQEEHKVDQQERLQRAQQIQSWQYVFKFIQKQPDGFFPAFFFGHSVLPPVSNQLATFLPVITYPINHTIGGAMWRLANTANPLAPLGAAGGDLTSWLAVAKGLGLESTRFVANMVLPFSVGILFSNTSYFSEHFSIDNEIVKGLVLGNIGYFFGSISAATVERYYPRLLVENQPLPAGLTVRCIAQHGLHYVNRSFSAFIAAEFVRGAILSAEQPSLLESSVFPYAVWPVAAEWMLAANARLAAPGHINTLVSTQAKSTEGGYYQSLEEESQVDTSCNDKFKAVSWKAFVFTGTLGAAYAMVQVMPSMITWMTDEDYSDHHQEHASLALRAAETALPYAAALVAETAIENANRLGRFVVAGLSSCRAALFAKRTTPPLLEYDEVAQPDFVGPGNLQRSNL